MLEINTATEMQNAFDGIISRLDPKEERMSELEDISVEISNRKLKSKEKKRLKNKNQNITSKNYWTTTNDVMHVLHVIGIPEGEKRKAGTKGIFEEIITEKSHQINVRSRKLRQYQAGYSPPKLNLNISYSTCGNQR